MISSFGRGFDSLQLHTPSSMEKDGQFWPSFPVFYYYYYYYSVWYLISPLMGLCMIVLDVALG